MLPAIVDQDWLRRHEEPVVLADVRWYLDGRSGRAAYEDGHLPGAVFVDLERWLAADGTRDEGRHPLPKPGDFAEGMGALGFSDADIVIAYDDAGGVIAARLIWMLRASGHDAALLDGGRALFEGPLERSTQVRPPAVFTCGPWPVDRLAGLAEAASSDNIVLDARDRGRFRGEPNPIDRRAGHIPGARNLPCRENLAPNGALLSIDELRRRFGAAGVTNGQGERVVSYCGSGVTACHNLLVMEHAGLGTGRLYPGSWSQYSERDDLPIATGDA